MLRLTGQIASHSRSTRCCRRARAHSRCCCRVLLSIMYLMVETIRVRTEDDGPEWKAAREAFRNELGAC